MKYDKIFMALLGATAAHAEASRKIFNDYGLTESQPKILYILNFNEGIVQKDFASLCAIKPPTLTVQLSRLEKDGLIRKESSNVPNGKKAYRIYLTPKGKEISDSLIERIDKLEEISFKDFTKDEKNQLLTLLERVENNLS
ncbi:MAG: MarR family transcriptional regulator [Eubacterium sp.]|nr:MarR family transcriptional regulator [Eubacterium sp.]